MITAQEIKDNTSMFGNVDKDRFMHLLDIVEVTVLEVVLGTALYKKIKTDYEANALADEYLYMYENYIKQVLWHSVYAYYLRDARVLAKNTGVYSNSPENGQISELEEVKWSVKNAQSIADIYIDRLSNYLCDVNVPEYNNSQLNDYDVSPSNGINTKSGLWFGSTRKKRTGYEQP